MSAGCRALTLEEIDDLRNYFERIIGSEDDKFNLATRNFTLIFFSFYSGFRISEILSIKVEDVYQFGHVTDSVYLKKSNTKRQVAGRNGMINEKCQALLNRYLTHYGLTIDISAIKDKPLFFSRKGGSLGKWQAHKIFTDAFTALELTGKLATHTGRKTFASNVYNLLDRNIVDLQQAMGHQSINSTQKYIAFDDKKIQAALQKLDF